MKFPKDVYYSVCYKCVDPGNKLLFGQIKYRHFKTRPMAYEFFNGLDKRCYDAHIELVERTMLDYVQSDLSKNNFTKFYEVSKNDN